MKCKHGNETSHELKMSFLLLTKRELHKKICMCIVIKEKYDIEPRSLKQETKESVTLGSFFWNYLSSPPPFLSYMFGSEPLRAWHSKRTLMVRYKRTFQLHNAIPSWSKMVEVPCFLMAWLFKRINLRIYKRMDGLLFIHKVLPR